MVDADRSEEQPTEGVQDAQERPTTGAPGGQPRSQRKKPKRNWIQEERRQTLGDWVSFCLSCGHVQRFFEADEPQLPRACPFCEGEMRHRCPTCNALLPSAFQIECEECGGELRPNELFGVPIRREGR